MRTGRFFLSGALCACALMVSVSALGQTTRVSGVVTDEFGPVAGAYVTIKGTSQGTITDVEGRYSLEVPSDAKSIEVSFIGYATETVSLSGSSTYDVTLRSDDVMLDELVAVGYAKVKRRDLTGATSSVQAEDLVGVPAVTAAQALQGKAAGVNIVTESGAPGASANITVRGGTSITQSTSPLYIVDGFEMSDALSNIDVNDIESIDVLKDASSTAIYGARGSNGIILITTKSGKKGKTKVSYNGYFSFDRLSKKLDMMDDVEDFVKYQYDFSVMQGKEVAFANVFDNSKATNEDDYYSGAYGRISSAYAGAEAIDWQDEVFGGSALTQSHNLTVTTGSESTQLLLSYNNNKQNGLLANHGVLKNSVRAKVNSQLYEHVKLDLNMMYAQTKTDGGGAYSGMKNVLLQPITGGTLFSRDEMLTKQTYADFSSLDTNYDTANPLVQNEASTSSKKHKLFTVNAGVDIDFLKMFTWRTAGSYTTSNTYSTSFADENSTSYIMDPVTTGMNGGIGNSQSHKWQLTNTLSFNKDIAETHKVGALLGHEVTYSESKSNSISLKQFPYPDLFGLDDISQADVKEKKTSHSHSGIVSVFGRLNYSYADKYMLTVTMRADGSSKFADGNRWGYFPSAAAAWRISGEDFWKDSSISYVMDNFKIRVGYGTTGNCNISDNMYATVFNQTDYPVNNTEGSLAYTVSSTLGNEDLKWETLHSTNIGADISFLGGKVNFTAEWYRNKVEDLLLKCTIPSATGYKNQYQNIGQMQNQGWEFTVNSTNINNSWLKWNTDLNLAFNKSEVLSLENGIDSKVFSVGSNRTGTVSYYATVGERLGDMYGYKYEGIYTTDDFNEDMTLKDGVVRPVSGTAAPGDIKFAADDVDESGNPKFTRKLVKIGNGTPKCIGGLNNTFASHGFDLNIFLKFAVGFDVYNATKHSMSPYSSFQNVPKEFGENYYRLVDSSTGAKVSTLSEIKALNPDESARTWSLSGTNTSYITYPSSYFVEDGSYLRIQTLTLGYTFKKELTRKAYIENARIYFTVNNLATITGYSGYDPEASAANDEVVCTPGYDSSTYPRSRSFVAGINLTF